MSLRPALASPQGDAVLRLREQLNQRSGPATFPVHPALAGLLPEAGLRPGVAYSVATPGALLLALLAEPSRAGSWCGVVGLPELGAEAAELAGVELSRLALVPRPGERWLAVTAALVEVLPVVAVRPSTRVRDADAARLAARLRDREAVLLVAGDWPQAHARLSLAEPDWSGLGSGHGYLSGREVTVTVTAKRAPVPRSARLLLPDPDGRLAPAAAPMATPVPLSPEPLSSRADPLPSRALPAISLPVDDLGFSDGLQVAG